MIRLSIDPQLCQGHARCLALAPDVFGYDDTENLGLVVADPVPEGAEEAVLLAIDSCPERAIVLRSGGDES